MFCSKCGNKVEDGVKFCPSCGSPVESSGVQPSAHHNENPAPFGITPQEQAPSNGGQRNDWGGGRQSPKPVNGTSATGALVCGIISLFCFGLILGIVAVVLGNKAKKEIVAEGGSTGTATAAIVLGIIGIVGWAVLMIWQIAIGFTLLNFNDMASRYWVYTF